MKSIERQYQDEIDGLKAIVTVLLNDLRTLEREWNSEANGWGSESDFADGVKAGKGRAAKQLRQVISTYEGDGD